MKGFGDPDSTAFAEIRKVTVVRLRHPSTATFYAELDQHRQRGS
jgi:hypothetical protein